MADSNKMKSMRAHLYVIYILAAVLVISLWYFNWELGLLMTFVLVISLYYTLQKELQHNRATEQYISTLSHRMKRVGEEALLEMPIGIVLYNEELHVEWSNPYINQFCEEETIVGKSLQDISETLVDAIEKDEQTITFPFGEYFLYTRIKKEDRLLYLFDYTEHIQTKTLYEDNKTAVAIIYLDNYDEITTNMEDTLKSKLNSEVTSALNEWAQDHHIYLKRTSQDRFLAVLTQKALTTLEGEKFSILDKIRQIDVETDRRNPVTLSIGVGKGDASLNQLGELAQSSLDLALGRGGDQVVVKNERSKVEFYGGKTNPMEKRTRVRARVISHALRDLVKASDKVMIMGHKMPDMDSLGAAIGILNIAKSNGIDGYIVFDEKDIHVGVQRIIEQLQQDESIWQHFIDSDDAEEMITNQSLAVVVDTHKPALVANERLLTKTDYRVVIDHHRRGEDFIENPTLVYMEPYASSTSELVTELLEYQPVKMRLSMLEATALLAGIIVDTKSFTLRTGSRTFDAASYLRSKGADTVLVQQLMKEDMDVYIRRSQLIEQAEVSFDSIAISKTDEAEEYDQVLIAQAADTLLTLSGIEASFVVAKISEDRIGVSARSLGDVNVQVIMEKLGGGGHLTNAATQLEDTTIDQVYEQLKLILDEYFKESAE